MRKPRTFYWPGLLLSKIDFGEWGDSSFLRFKDAFKNRDKLDESFSEMRVEVSRRCSSIALRDDLHDNLVIQTGFIGSSAPKGIVLVNNIHDSSCHGDFFRSKSPWVSSPVPSFMVGQRNRFSHLEVL